MLRRLLNSLQEAMRELNCCIDEMDNEITALSRQQTAYPHLLTIPCVDPLIAGAFVNEVNAEQFLNGRQLSAWCGLVPRQHSSGGKARLSSLSKNGNHHLRTLIIHGTRFVMRCARKRDDTLGWKHINLIDDCVWRSSMEIGSEQVQVVMVMPSA